MLFRFVLAAVVGLSACSDDGGDTVPNAGDVTGPGTVTTLRQAATLSGGYANRISLGGEGWPVSSGAQEMTITFQMDGMAGVGQFEMRVTPEPANAFDVDGAVFAAAQPFVTPFASGIQIEGGAMRMGGASLGSGVDGTASLGTLTIRTSSSFNSFTNARLVISALSVGPSSSQRDGYESDILRLGIDVSQ